jgi:hypothetical protein
MDQELSEQRIKELALAGASDDDICELHGVEKGELKRRFGKVLKAGRAERRVELRKLQNVAATKGSAGILTLLGKNELGQDGKQRTGVYRWPEPQLDPKVG